MNDVQQILLWETRRKALQWWGNLTVHQRYEELKKNGIDCRVTKVPQPSQIELMYENRES